MVKIDFAFDTPYGVFRDALWLEENHGLTDEQIDALQAERLSNWLDVIANSPAPAIAEIDGVLFEEVPDDGQALPTPDEV